MTSHPTVKLVHSRHEPPYACPELDVLLASVEESGWRRSAVAAELGVSDPQLSAMLSGERAVTLRRLSGLPLEIRQRFARRLAEALGLREDRPTALRAVADELERLAPLTLIRGRRAA